MKIGKHELKNNLILAPMAGFSTPAMRRLCARLGAGLTVTEMVSVKGLLYGNAKTNDLLGTSLDEKVKCVQLFGKVPQDFYDCARLPQLAEFDIIDINMGCPVRKIITAGEGSALINQPDLAADIVRAAKSAGRTVTVKTRLPESGDPAAFALTLQKAGADMITIHARTASQMYRGTADYEAFALVKKALSVPVALSGDITDVDSYHRAKAAGADLFMIGRGAVANPAIFADILAMESGQEQHADKFPIVLRLLDYMAQDLGENHAVRAFRKFLPYVVKGGKCTREQKHKLNFIEDMGQLKSALTDILVTE